MDVVTHRAHSAESFGFRQTRTKPIPERRKHSLYGAVKTVLVEDTSEPATLGFYFRGGRCHIYTSDARRIIQYSNTLNQIQR